MRSLYLVGPTGSGKSSLASLIANDLNGEIINADAFQLYKGIEIITASPNKKELNRAPHHLYGILNLDEESNAGKYSIIAKEKIKEIKENTMQYQRNRSQNVTRSMRPRLIRELG